MVSEHGSWALKKGTGSKWDKLSAWESPSWGSKLFELFNSIRLKKHEDEAIMMDWSHGCRKSRKATVKTLDWARPLVKSFRSQHWIWGASAGLRIEDFQEAFLTPAAEGPSSGDESWRCGTGCGSPQNIHALWMYVCILWECGHELSSNHVRVTHEACGQKS